MRMRINQFAFFSFILSISLLQFNTPAQAQSIFDFLFGKPQSTHPQPSQRGASSHGNYGPGATHSRSRSSQDYKTMCVRLCDGFYFPIQSRTTRRSFHRDARACKQRCGGRAKLFYLPASSENIENMVDLSGHRYADLKHAFKYRKKLVSGCSCRPMPWSHAERARHQRYAAIAAMEASRDKEKAEAEQNIAVAEQETTGERKNSQVDIMDLRYVTIDGQPLQTTANLGDEPPTKTSRSARKTRKRRYAKKHQRRRKAKKSTSWFASSGTKYRWPGDS